MIPRAIAVYNTNNVLLFAFYHSISLVQDRLYFLHTYSFAEFVGLILTLNAFFSFAGLAQETVDNACLPSVSEFKCYNKIWKSLKPLHIRIVGRVVRATSDQLLNI